TTVAVSQPPKDPKTYRRTKRGQNTEIAQFGGSPSKVGDKTMHKVWGHSVVRAATTASRFEAQQTGSEGIPNLSSDLPLSGGHTLGSGEDSMEHHIELTDNEPNTPNDSPLTGVNTLGSDKGSLERTELMDLVQKLSQRVLDLEKEKTAQAKEETEFE
ncbi:hypothetical protein Tco_0142408, partial [Tanacetum coccineum]